MNINLVEVKHDFASGEMRVITQGGRTPHPDLPNVPLMRELAKDAESQAILDYVSKATAVGRPVGTTPDTPKDRVAALRKAFDDTLNDPEFKAESDKQKMEISPMSGAELQQLITDLIDAPKDLLEKVRQVTNARDAKELPGAKPSAN